MTLEKAFNFNSTTVRVSGTEIEPLFCATDVCKVLGIKNNRDAVRRLDEQLDATRKTLNERAWKNSPASQEPPVPPKNPTCLFWKWISANAHNMELGDMAVWAANRVHVGQYAGRRHHAPD